MVNVELAKLIEKINEFNSEKEKEDQKPDDQGNPTQIGDTLINN